MNIGRALASNAFSVSQAIDQLVGNQTAARRQRVDAIRRKPPRNTRGPGTPAGRLTRLLCKRAARQGTDDAAERLLFSPGDFLRGKKVRRPRCPMSFACRDAGVSRAKHQARGHGSTIAQVRPHDLRQLKHCHLRLAEHRQQFGIGIDRALVLGVL